MNDFQIKFEFIGNSKIATGCQDIENIGKWREEVTSESVRRFAFDQKQRQSRKEIKIRYMIVITCLLLLFLNKSERLLGS